MPLTLGMDRKISSHAGGEGVGAGVPGNML